MSGNSDDHYHQELVSAFFDNWLAFTMVPLAVGIVAYLVAASAPPNYTSIGYLSLDKRTAMPMEALMRSPGIADAVLSPFPRTGATPEQRQRYLVSNLRITDSEPQGDGSTFRPYRLSLTYPEPAVAQTIATNLITAWLESTKPRPDRKAIIEFEIARLEALAEATGELLEKVRSEATTLILPNSISGEIATPITRLMEQRDAALVSLNSYRAELRGISHDVILQPPHLPVDPVSRKATFVILAMLASIPALLGMILMVRFSRRQRRRADA